MPSDREVLMLLYESTGGANWKNHKNWGTNVDVKQWHGVEKVSGDGRVEKLVLVDNNLRGIASPKLQYMLWGWD